jgi:hypothetical protein
MMQIVSILMLATFHTSPTEHIRPIVYIFPARYDSSPTFHPQSRHIMARKKTTTEEGAQEQPQAPKTSKTDAVRVALAEGFDTPQAGVPFIRDRYGIDLNPQHFSAIKSQLKKRDGRPKGKRGRKPRAALAAPAANGSVDLLGTLEAIKHLVEEHGADNVKRMVDLVG